MTIADHFAALKERLITDAVVANFRIRRERMTISDGHLRAQLTLIDGSTLEFSEYFQLTPDGLITVVTYSYHWSDEEGKLIRRWDNTPHYPGLAGFPHHVHDGHTDQILPGEITDIHSVLDKIRLILVPSQ